MYHGENCVGKMKEKQRRAKSRQPANYNQRKVIIVQHGQKK